MSNLLIIFAPLIFILAVFIPVFLIMFVVASDTGRTWFMTTFLRRKKIYVKRKRDNDYFTTYLRRDPFGEVSAFRYPSSRTGSVHLKDDFTGEDFGSVVWKFAEPRFSFWGIVKRVAGLLKRTKKPGKVSS